MTIEQVIEAKKMSWGESLQLFGLNDWLTMLIGFPFIALFLSALCLSPFAFVDEGSDHNTDDKFYNIAFTFLFVVALSFTFAYGFQGLANQYEPENWREDIAVPFYESIPKTVHEIDIISIEGTQDPALFQVMFALKNEDGILVHDTVLSSIERKATAQTPTYEYRMVTEEIPNFKDEGKHEELIILPADYTMMTTTMEQSPR